MLMLNVLCANWGLPQITIIIANEGVSPILQSSVRSIGASILVWIWLIGHYPASSLTSFTFLTPLFGVLAGGLLLHEPMTPAFIIALALVSMGIYLVNRSTTN